MKTVEETNKILQNERALTAIYLREFTEKKITKKHFIEIVARMLSNTEDLLKD